jgi:hypothetical protein
LTQVQQLYLLKTAISSSYRGGFILWHHIFWYWSNRGRDGDPGGLERFPGHPLQRGSEDPQKVFEDRGEDTILLCWEAPGKFCRRRLVAAWLEEKLGVQVPELPQGYYHNQRNLFV